LVRKLNIYVYVIQKLIFNNHLHWSRYESLVVSVKRNSFGELEQQRNKQRTPISLINRECICLSGRSNNQVSCMKHSGNLTQLLAACAIKLLLLYWS